jgi:nucleoside-diphosphate-sugar epimerase
MKKIFISGGNGNIANMIKNNLKNHYIFFAPNHKELDILDYNKLKEYIHNIKPDIIIHTAILGGRRTKEETSDVFYKNIIMFENLVKCSINVKMIINLDSAAIYDRKYDIYNRKEYELNTIPEDYYGFSKYVIYQRSLSLNNVYNFRIFNIFHTNEEKDRFIKGCFLAKENNTEFNINDDKFFDFVYEDDFVKIIKYYIDNFDKNNLDKTLNICYKKKYKLSEIVKIIENIGKYKKINLKIINTECKHNYCGNNNLLYNIKDINLDGLEKSLEKYNNLII